MYSNTWNKLLFFLINVKKLPHSSVLYLMKDMIKTVEKGKLSTIPNFLTDIAIFDIFLLCRR